MNSSTNIASTATPKRGRNKSQRKRQLIVEAASELFVAKGFNATSMDRIAQLAGVSKQTVYSHFGNKEELFRFCIESRCPVVAMSDDILQADNPLREVLVTAGQKLLTLLISRESVQITRLCMNGAEQHPEISRLFFAAGPNNLANQLAKFFDLKTAAGDMCVADSHHAAWQFVSIVRGEFALRAHLGILGSDEAVAMADYIESCVDVFLRFYTP